MDSYESGPWGWIPPAAPRRHVADADMRVSDAERNEIGEALSRHFADGRLDQAEFDERMGRAMAAKTRRDLAGLLADLPPLAGDAPASPIAGTPPPPVVAPRAHGLVRAALLVAGALLIAGSVGSFAFHPALWVLMVLGWVLLVGRHRHDAYRGYRPAARRHRWYGGGWGPYGW